MNNGNSYLLEISLSVNVIQREREVSLCLFFYLDCDDGLLHGCVCGDDEEEEKVSM